MFCFTSDQTVVSRNYFAKVATRLRPVSRAAAEIVCKIGKIQKDENRIFSLKCCITAFREFNQSLLDFFNFVDLQLIFTLLQTH